MYVLMVETAATLPDARDPLTRDRIARAALAVVDAEGLEALTMRRLAAELGAAPMSAYAHFAGKRELLAEVVDAVLGDVELPEIDGRWRKPIRRLAGSLRSALLAHPAVMPAFHASGGRGRNALAVLDRAHGILRGAGFPDEQVVRVVDTIHAFILGSAALEIAWASLDPASRHAQIFAVPQSAYPDLTAVMPQVVASSGDDRFRYGLDRILDGVAAARRST